MANGFERYGKKTRRTLIVEELWSRLVRCTELCALVEPVYAEAGNGRPPVAAERMLRIHFLQRWSTCLTRGRRSEEALYDSAGMRQFVGIDLGREPVSDQTTVCKFRHLLGRRVWESGCSRAITWRRTRCDRSQSEELDPRRQPTGRTEDRSDSFGGGKVS